MNEIQQKELADARRGTVYFLSNLEMIKKPSFDLGIISNFGSNTAILSDLQTATKTIVSSCDVGRKVIDGMEAKIAPIRQLFTSFFDALAKKLYDLYGEGVEALEWIGEFTAWAVSMLVGSLSDIIPGWGYVSGALDIYEGVKRSVLSAIKWLGQVFSGWGVELLQGGPSIISQAIARHNATSLAGGLKDIAIESVKMGLQAGGDAAAGVGSIIGAVTGILQRIANLIGYFAQRALMRRVITKASYQWGSDGELLHDHTAFNHWFKVACVTTPVIAALTMISGFVGHPYRFLSLISDDNEIIEQKDFDQGILYIEKLKSLSVNYIKEYQDAYKLEFTGSDKLVYSRLADALNQ